MKIMKYLRISLVLSGMLAVGASAQTNADGKPVRERADIYFEEGKLNFATKNNNFRLKLDNRIYTDFSYYHPTTSVDGLSSKPNDDLVLRFLQMA